MAITTLSPGPGRFARMASSVKVLQNTRISPNIALIRLQTTGSPHAFQPGDKIKFAVPGGSPKSYTPARLQNGELHILCELHGNGPTARWAANATLGDIAWTTPAFSSLRIPHGPIWFQGDATALGLALSLHEAPRFSLAGVIELSAADVEVVRTLGLPLTAVDSGQAHTVAPQAGRVAVVAGEASLVSDGVRAMRAAGVTQVCSKPYWSRKGRAHRKWVAMTTGGAQ